MRGPDDARLLRTAAEGLRNLRRGEVLVLAVSGGGDSTALTHLVAGLSPRRGIRFCLAHLNHLLRGRASTADENFVRRLAADLRVPFFSERVDVQALARRTRHSVEMAAREARYDFLVRVARMTNAAAVATAHTSDDQAETVLLNLVRGTGLQGLCGIPAYGMRDGVRFLRPLLGVSGTDLRRYLRTHHRAWREDTSNRRCEPLRNRVRHEILPLLERRLNPRCREALCRMAGILREENDFLDREASRRRSDTLSIARLIRRPTALRRRIIRFWLIDHGFSADRLDFSVVDRIDRLASGSRASAVVPLHGSARVRRRGDEITVERGVPSPLRRRLLAVPGSVLLRSAGLRVTSLHSTGYEKNPSHMGRWPASVFLSAKKLGRRSLVIRSWKPGDRIRPWGMTGSKKLQDLFVDAKIPAEQRLHIPVLECGGEVVWVAGYRPAREWAVESRTAPSICIRVEPA